MSEMKIERRKVGSVDTRPLPHTERRHGAVDTRTPVLNLFRVTYHFRAVPADFKSLKQDFRPSPVHKIANVVAETDLAAGNFISATAGNEVVSVTLTTHDVVGAVLAPLPVSAPVPGPATRPVPLTERRHGAVDTRVPPVVERRHGAPETRTA